MGCTGVAVLFTRGRTALTDSSHTLVIDGTQVTIGAVHLVFHVDAPKASIAGVICALIAIVAISGQSRDTFSVLAEVSRCAQVPVFTFQVLNGHGHASQSLFTDRIRTLTLTDTFNQASATNPFQAKVFLCTRVPIVTGGGVQGMETASGVRITDVVCAQVIIVAKEEGGLIDAPFVRIALVFCASVAIITVDGLPKADSAAADVVEGAGVSIIALPFHQRGFTVPIVLFIADFKCTGVSVIAIELHSQAKASRTRIFYSAEGFVVAGAFIERECTAFARVADVIRAWIVILTRHVQFVGTDPVQARVQCADVPVIAEGGTHTGPVLADVALGAGVHVVT